MPPKKNGASKASSESVNYAISDTVLGKVRGFPPWPGWIVDPESTAPDVQKERPSKKAGVFCVQFFPTADHAWLDRKSISRLQKHEIEQWLKDPQKSKGDLLAGYKAALNPSKWDEERATSMEVDQDDDEDDDADADADGDDDVEAVKAKTTKKRKRESEVKTKPAKKAKAKTDSSAEPKKKAPRKSGGKSKAAVESEDEGADADGEEDKPATKKSKKAAKDDEDNSELAKDPEANKVREWRHKLQKTFLPTNKIPPKPEDMGNADELFKTVESYEDMSIEYLQFSKIGKVMRHVAALEDERLPRDSEFNFRARAKALVDRWQAMMSANGGPASDAGGAAKSEDVKMDEAKAAEPESAPAPASKPAPEGEAEPEAEKTNGDVAAAPEAVAETESKDAAEVAPEEPKEAATEQAADVTMTETEA